MSKIYNKIAQVYAQVKDGVWKNTMWEMSNICFTATEKQKRWVNRSTLSTNLKEASRFERTFQQLLISSFLGVKSWQMYSDADLHVIKHSLA